MKTIVTIMLACLVSYAGVEVNQNTENSDWVEVADQVWTKNERGNTYHLAKGKAGMSWTLERTIDKIGQAEAAYLQTGDESWLKRISDLEDRVSKLEVMFTSIGKESAGEDDECCQPWFGEICDGRPVCAPNEGEALAYAGHLPGGGTEAEAQAWWHGSYPADITLSCTAVANGLSDHTYITRNDVYNDGLVCYGNRVGTNACSAYAFAEVLAGYSGLPKSVYYEMESGVVDCFEPLPQVSCSIDMPSLVVADTLKTVRLTGLVENGTGNYDYEWVIDGNVAAIGQRYYLPIGPTNNAYILDIRFNVYQSGNLVTTCQRYLTVNPPN